MLRNLAWPSVLIGALFALFGLPLIARLLGR